jgi:hypothetical protein
MSSKEREIGRQWLEYSKGDLQSAAGLLNITDIPLRNVCYLAQ